MLMVKVIYHPHWRATVEGSKVGTVMLMPGFVGIQLAPGEHEVKLEYRSRSLRKVLLVFGLVAILSIWVWEKRSDTISAWLKNRVEAGVPSPMVRAGGNRASRRRRGRRNR